MAEIWPKINGWKVHKIVQNMAKMYDLTTKGRVLKRPNSKGQNFKRPNYLKSRKTYKAENSLGQKMGAGVLLLAPPSLRSTRARFFRAERVLAQIHSAYSPKWFGLLKIHIFIFDLLIIWLYAVGSNLTQVTNTRMARSGRPKIKRPKP